jgi:hypothetical protein
MSAVPLTVVVLASSLSGAALGTIFGFVLASHRDVLAWIRPTRSNTFVRWLARPTSEASLRDGLLYLLLLLVWLVVFFALCAVPIAAAAQFADPGSTFVKVAGFLFLGVAFISRRLGARLWKRCV